MQIKLLHAILSGIIIALTLGIFLIPKTWQIISEEPVFGPSTNGVLIVGIIAAAVVVIILISFRLVRRISE